MKSYSWILVAVFSFSFNAFSQQKTKEHIVAKGETISKIAKQYNLKISDIYDLNPEAKNGINFKSVLLIPTSNQKELTSSKLLTVSETTHEVLAKETLYGISKEYGLSVDDLYKANPGLEGTGLKVGSKISILGGNKLSAKTKELNTILSPVLVNESKEIDGIDYEVLAKQTKYSIAKDYGITVALLEKANPILQTEELKIGQKIIIPVKKYVPDLVVSTKEIVNNVKEVEKNEPIKEIEIIENTQPKEIPALVSQTNNIAPSINSDGIEYEVLAKQTKYSIAKDYGITVALLEKANPVLQTEELKIGQKIIIPVKKYIPDLVVAENDVVKDKKEVDIQKVEPKKETLIKETVEATKTVVGNEVYHEVLAKETKYGIAKEYGVTVSDIDRANPSLESEGLKIGQKIIIPAKGNSPVIQQQVEVATPKEVVVADVKTVAVDKSVDDKPVVENKSETGMITHKVAPKETKYGIAKEYGITVNELDRLNPKVGHLNVGTVLIIQGTKSVDSSVTKGEFVIEDVDENSNIKSYKGSDFADQIISTASENIGVRYRMGGTSKSGFDCSGLMCVAYAAHDVQLPRTSLEQSRYGEVVEIEKAQKGDLIFFKTRGGRQINHVGMVVEAIDGDVKFIHASNSGVMISSIKESYYAKRVVQVNRVL